jgi:hypothetical protein
MLFDRRKMLTQLADKAAMRTYVESRLGPQVLPTLYYLTDRPETIPFDKLPEEFVVKPNHGSGWVQIVRGKGSLDRTALIETCAGWLKQSYYEETREWPYKHIEPRIIVEQFIDDGKADTHCEYKFYVFDGVVQFIHVDVDIFTNPRQWGLTPAWETIKAGMKFEDVNGQLPPPLHLKEMLAAAEALGRGGVDFIRVDLYDTPSCLYVGELTTTPNGGMRSFHAPGYDLHFGSHWKLPPLKLRSLLGKG